MFHDVKKFDVWSLGQTLFSCLDKEKSEILKETAFKKRMLKREKITVKMGKGS